MDKTKDISIKIDQTIRVDKSAASLKDSPIFKDASNKEDYIINSESLTPIERSLREHFLKYEPTVIN